MKLHKRDEMKDYWDQRLARRMGGVTSSAIRELFTPAQQPGMISFAGGMPTPKLLPTEAVREASERVLIKHGAQALQYGSTEGYPPLRAWIVERMALQGVNIYQEDVLIISGAQQGLDLTARLFLNSGDRVVVEAPTFLGGLQAFNAYQAVYETVPVDEEGMRVDQLGEVLSRGPRFIYTVPTFQNPSGVTLSIERRQQLIEMAAQAKVPILEDDPYHQLRYDGEHVPSLLAIDMQKIQPDRKHGFQGDVVYIGTFSKLLGPGLRLGWAIAPAYLIRRMVQAKQGVDLHTSLYVQMVVYEMLRNGFFEKHITRLCTAYRERRDVMLTAMKRYFPAEVNWTRPQGGLFIWVTLPTWLDANDLLQNAMSNKVAFVPGAPFFVDKSGSHTLRLNYSYPNLEEIETGIRRLGEILYLACETRLATTRSKRS